MCQSFLPNVKRCFRNERQPLILNIKKSEGTRACALSASRSGWSCIEFNSSARRRSIMLSLFQLFAVCLHFSAYKSLSLFRCSNRNGRHVVHRTFLNADRDRPIRVAHDLLDRALLRALNRAFVLIDRCQSLDNQSNRAHHYCVNYVDSE